MQYELLINNIFILRFSCKHLPTYIMEKLKKKLYDLVKNKNNISKLQDFLITVESKSLLEFIKASLNRKDGFAIINSILSALNCVDERSTFLKVQVYECILKFLRFDEVLTEKESGQLVSSLIVNAENFPTDALHSLIQIYLHSLVSNKEIAGRWSELLGKLISLTGKRNDINVDGELFTSQEYQRHILNSLCNPDWDTKTAITILSVYRDLNLTEKDVDEVLYKIETVLKKVDYQSVPPILYNLILISQAKLPERVLRIVIDYFNKQDLNFEREDNTKEDISSVSQSNLYCNGNRDELNEAAATMILHITHLTWYNSKLVKDYIKFVKNSSWLSNQLITPFNLSLALSLSSIDRYRDQILDSLKSCILKHYRLKEKASTSLWIKKTCFEDYDILQVFINTAKMSQSGWDQVSQGMVNLCFSLLECGGGLKGEMYPNQQAIGIAISVLPVIMRKESQLTPSVLNQLSSYMFTSSSSHRYLDMMTRLVQVIPHVLLEHIDIVRDILEQITLLPHSVAVELLHILLPLFKMSMTLKDALVLILRKMLFSREIEKRQVSVEGFIMFLCHFRIMGTIPSSQGYMSFSSTLSQVSADVHTSFDSNTNEALCLEFLGILRRCFSQQAEVKSVLYSGFYEVVKSNPKLGSNVLTILYEHLLNFIDTRQEALNPIYFHKICSMRGEIVLINEPFGELLSALCDCKVKYSSFLDKNNNDNEEDDNLGELLANVSSTCDILSEKLAHMDMDDMDFGNASFLPTTDKGKLNLIRAHTTIRTFDALLNYVFNSGASIHEDKAKLFMSLFKTQRILVDLVQKSSNKSTKKAEQKEKTKSTSTTKQNIRRILKLETAVKVLRVCLGVDCKASSKCVEIFQQHTDLQLYLLSVFESVTKNMTTFPAQKRNRYFHHLKAAAKVLFHECDKCLINVDAHDSTESHRISQVLNCFNLMFNMFFKLFQNRLPEVLETLAESSSDDVGANLYVLAKKTQNMSRVLFGGNASNMIKESILLINLLSLITKHMESSENLTNLYTWLHQICKDETSNSAQLCEAIFVFLYRLADQIKINNSLCRFIAKDIYTSLGDNEEQSETEESVSYQIISDDTSLAALSATISYVDDSLSQVELALSVLKCCLQVQVLYDRISVERLIVLKFGMLMQSLYEIIKSAVPQIAVIDQVFKTTTKLFSVLSTFMRYYLDVLKQSSKDGLSDKFERLVHAYGSFKEEVFKMINFHQGAQNTRNKNNTAALACRALKESKIIPGLIFGMEKYEKLLVQLSVKSKINLMMNVKLSTSRDFRISMPTVAKALQESDGQNDANDGSGNESEETVTYSREGSPSAKRLKQGE